MAHIPPEVIDQVRMQADIVDVIQSYIPLKKLGRDFKACCPFHNEKTPSFVVNQQRQWFHCFGCGKHGNVITFIMERENVDFPNAINILARRYNIYIPEETQKFRGGGRQYPQENAVPDKPNFKERMYILHEKAQAWFAKRLKESPDSPVAQYLKTRCLPFDTIEKFGIGASVDQWDAFMDFALRDGFSLDELVDSGLVVRTDDNPPKKYDRFRNRLMFPIWNEQGRVVGFSARTIEKEAKGAKYVNSPETPVFKKGRTLYALHLARQEIGQKKYAVLCEGQLDTIALHRAGVGNAIAPQGTAFTDEQAIMLKRYTDCLYLAFDSDDAGTKAIFRGAQLALPHGFALKVVRFPGGKDPDELLRNSGAEEVVRAVEEAHDFFEFALNTMNSANGSSPAGKTATAESMLDLILYLESDAAKSAYVSWLAEQLRLSPAALGNQLSRMTVRRNRENERYAARPANPSPNADAPAPPKPKAMTPAEAQYRKALKELLSCILGDEHAADAASKQIHQDLLDNSVFSRAIDLVIQMKMLGEWSDAPARILEHFATENPDAELSALLMQSAPEETEETKPSEESEEDRKKKALEAAHKEAVRKRMVSHTFRSCMRILHNNRFTITIQEKMEVFRSLPPADPARTALARELAELSRQRALSSTDKDPLGPKREVKNEDSFEDDDISPPVEF